MYFPAQEASDPRRSTVLRVPFLPEERFWSVALINDTVVYFIMQILLAGVPTFRALSPIMAYSVCFYVLVNLISYFSVKYRLLEFLRNVDTMENVIYGFMIISALVSFLCTPVLAWFDTPKAVQYFDSWGKFQVRILLGISNMVGFDIGPKLKF
jgi:hypothetical protein